MASQRGPEVSNEKLKEETERVGRESFEFREKKKKLARNRRVPDGKTPGNVLGEMVIKIVSWVPIARSQRRGVGTPCREKDHGN